MPTGILVAVGLGLAAGGAALSYSASKDTAAAQQGIAQQEMKADKQRQQAMELDAQRRMRENVRNMQRAHSTALSNATSQNAQFGSGLPGGYGQISGYGGTEQLGISQNLQIGENLFGINQQINMYKMAISGYQSTAALGSGLSSLGGAMIQGAGTMGNIFGGARSPAAFGGGNYASNNNFMYNYNRGMV